MGRESGECLGLSPVPLSTPARGSAALDAETRAAHDRNKPVVKARMRRCTNAVSTEGRFIGAQRR
jgi:hypothetical protein